MGGEKKPRAMPEERIEQLLKNASTPEDLTRKEGLTISSTTPENALAIEHGKTEVLSRRSVRVS